MEKKRSSGSDSSSTSSDGEQETKRPRHKNKDPNASAAKAEAKAEAAKELTFKKNMTHHMKDAAFLRRIMSFFEVRAPDDLQALVTAPDVVLSPCDQLLNRFAVMRKSHKLMRKDWKLQGKEFGRQDSWPEMGIKSNRADSLLNAMIESLALMYKRKHVCILVNTESTESKTLLGRAASPTWKAKRAALVELDRDFGIRSAIETADVHKGIKTIAIDILNQIAKADSMV